MKKLFVILAMACMGSLASCSSETGGNTGVQGDSEQMNGGESGVVNANPNDTTGASATEQTQEAVGNSQQRGESNNSKSNTTQNQELPKEQ